MATKISRKKQYRDYLEQLANDPKYKDKITKHRGNYTGTLSLSIGTEDSDTINEDISIFTRSELVIEQISVGELTLGALDMSTKCGILYYLERYNKRVGRILDILTRIPLSTMRLQKPKTKYSIVNDYVYKKFNDMFESFEFQSAIEKMVRHYWLFGFAAIMIEDDFEFLKGTTQMDEIDTSKSFKDLKVDKKLTKEDIAEIKNIEESYRTNPDDVPSSERRKVVEAVLNIQSPKYRGIKRVTVLPVEATLTRQENYDIDYFIYLVKISDNLKETIKGIRESLDFSEDSLSNIIEEAGRVGYSRAMVEAAMNLNSDNPSSVAQEDYADSDDTILVDTDPYSTTGMYVVQFHRNGLAQKDNSVFNRVINDAIDLAISSRRLREKINRGFKKDVLITTSEKEDEAKIEELQQAFDDMAANEEGSIVITNMQVSTSDVDLNVNANIDLSEIIDAANRNISEGVGISESLITDSQEAYANSFLKTLILENELVSFRNNIVSLIEKKIFEPIAVKLGFVVTNEWGELEPIYPKLKFNRMSLARGSDDLVFLQEMAADGKMPMSEIYEALGFDTEEVIDKIRKEQTTLLNTTLRDAFSEGLAESYGSAVSKSEKLIEDIARAFDINVDDLKKLIDGNGAE